MKKIILTLSFLFILIIGYSQESNYKKNEVSIGLINLTESPKNQEILFENSYYFVPFSNLTYKRFINRSNAIRLTYHRPINKSYDDSGGDWVNKGEYKEQVLKIGYEYVFKQKRLTPYIAVDITYLKSTSSRIAGGGFTGAYDGLEKEIKGFGLSPTVGVNYKIYSRVFIGLESNLNILKFNENLILSTYKSYANPKETRITKADTYSEYILNPIIFLVKVKF